MAEGVPIANMLTVNELKDHLAFTDDIGTADDRLLEQKLGAALGHVERMLGYKIFDRFGGDGQETVPPSLREAVLQLAAHWYDNREAGAEAVRELPFGVREIVTEFREFTF